MSEHKTQGNDLIFALDIGTRSVIGVVGKAEGDRFKVLDVETAEHKKRAMLDGQIDNIRQVAELALPRCVCSARPAAATHTRSRVTSSRSSSRCVT